MDGQYSKGIGVQTDASQFNGKFFIRNKDLDYTDNIKPKCYLLTTCKSASDQKAEKWLIHLQYGGM